MVQYKLLIKLCKVKHWNKQLFIIFSSIQTLEISEEER